MQAAPLLFQLNLLSNDCLLKTTPTQSTEVLQRNWAQCTTLGWLEAVEGIPPDCTDLGKKHQVEMQKSAVSSSPACVCCGSLYNHCPLLGEHIRLSKPVDVLKWNSHYADGFAVSVLNPVQQCCPAQVYWARILSKCFFLECFARLNSIPPTRTE